MGCFLCVVTLLHRFFFIISFLKFAANLRPFEKKKKKREGKKKRKTETEEGTNTTE